MVGGFRETRGRGRPSTGGGESEGGWFTTNRSGWPCQPPSLWTSVVGGHPGLSFPLFSFELNPSARTVRHARTSDDTDTCSDLKILPCIRQRRVLATEYGSYLVSPYATYTHMDLVLVGKYVFHVFTFRSNTSVFNVFTFALRIRERDVFNSYILTYFLLNLLIFTGISYVR